MNKSTYLKAREMRNNPTTAEARLWEVLRGRQVNGLRFLRQYRMGPYIADFYCHHLKLVLEVDGSVHNGKQQKAKDATRDQWCEQMGLRVLRVRNEDVLYNMDTLLQEMSDFFDTIENPKPPSA